MNITVIGHLCFDTVHHPNGSAAEGRNPGGIVYTIAALAAMSSPKDTIVPVVGVSQSDHETFLAWLKQFPQVKTDGIFILEGPTNEVHLFYGETGNSRIECSEHISPPIPFSTLRPFLDTNGILLNMISGFDITLETLDRIRMDIRDKGTPIHFDFHSLTLGIDQEHRRFRRPLSDWRRWSFMIDSIQLSEDEAAGLTTERYGESDLINQMMSLMVKNLLITRGNRGATLICQEHKKLSRVDIPGMPLTPAPDPTGCGDVFGAAFFLKYLETGSSRQAADIANKVAAYHTTYAGTGGLAAALRFLQQQTPA
ncbi:MAG: carbohydrate kinase family protein [Bacteroidota bacterium]